MARTSKKKIGIYDEGVLITDDVDSLDFIGAGVSTAVTLGDVDINIPGVGSSIIINITGTIDDTNVTFTATSEPAQLVINGGIYKQTGGAITWSYAAGTIILSSPIGSGGSIYGF